MRAPSERVFGCVVSRLVLVRGIEIECNGCSAEIAIRRALKQGYFAQSREEPGN
jgi:hypothetical protein